MSLADSLDFLTRRSHAPDVATGAVYRRRGLGNVTETAHVLSVRPDEMGISHVRFQVRIQQSGATRVEEERLLNLESFAARYHERVGG